MANMRTETCDRLKSEPENYDLDMSKFVLKAVKMDEVVYSQKGRNKSATGGRVAVLDAAEDSTSKTIATLKAKVAQLTAPSAPVHGARRDGKSANHPDPESEEGKQRLPSDTGPCPYCHEDHGIRHCYKVFVKNHPGEKIPKKIASSIPDWKKDQFQLAALTANICTKSPTVQNDANTYQHLEVEEVSESSDCDSDDSEGFHSESDLRPL